MPSVKTQQHPATEPARRPTLAHRRLRAGVIATELFRGSHVHPATGATYTYAGSCKVVVDLQGRESMHLRGSVFSGGGEDEFAVLGLVDHGSSFIGREQDAAVGWVKAMCDRRTIAG